MFRKLITCLLAMTTIGMGIANNGDEKISSYDALLHIFNESQCTIEYFNTNSSFHNEKEFISIDRQEEICDDIAETLDLINIKKNKEELPTYNSMILSGTNKYKDEIVIIIQSTTKNGYNDTIITLDCKNSNLDNYIKISEDIKTIMNNMGVNPSYSSVIVGYKGIEDSKSMLDTKYVEKLMKTVKGKVVESYVDEDIISLTGYSKKIDEYIEYADLKVNLNIAVSCDDYNNRTYLYLASPTINIEY